MAVAAAGASPAAVTGQRVEAEPHGERYGAALPRVSEVDEVILTIEHDALARRTSRPIDEAAVHAADLVGEVALLEAQRVRRGCTCVTWRHRRG